MNKLYHLIFLAILASANLSFNATAATAGGGSGAAACGGSGAAPVVNLTDMVEQAISALTQSVPGPEGKLIAVDYPTAKAKFDAINTPENSALAMAYRVVWQIINCRVKTSKHKNWQDWSNEFFTANTSHENLDHIDMKNILTIKVDDSDHISYLVDSLPLHGFGPAKQQALTQTIISLLRPMHWDERRMNLGITSNCSASNAHMILANLGSCVAPTIVFEYLETVTIYNPSAGFSVRNCTPNSDLAPEEEDDDDDIDYARFNLFINTDTGFNASGTDIARLRGELHSLMPIRNIYYGPSSEPVSSWLVDSLPSASESSSESETADQYIRCLHCNGLFQGDSQLLCCSLCLLKDLPEAGLARSFYGDISLASPFPGLLETTEQATTAAGAPAHTPAAPAAKKTRHPSKEAEPVGGEADDDLICQTAIHATAKKYCCPHPGCSFSSDRMRAFNSHREICTKNPARAAADSATEAGLAEGLDGHIFLAPGILGLLGPTEQATTEAGAPAHTPAAPAARRAGKHGGRPSKHGRRNDAGNYECPSCNYQTSQGCDIDRHIQKHTQQKRFKCPFPGGCDYRDAQSKNVVRHWGAKHKDNDMPYSCEYCGQGFIQEDHKTRHYGRCEKKPKS